jgi:hypothetical protein
MPIRFQVDPDFYDHPKAIGMSDSATALWVRAGSYSAAKLTDGFIAEAALSLLSRCPEEAASELVTRRLWKRVRGGYRFHEWGVRNLTRNRIEADREADRKRKQEERRAAKGQVNGHVVHPDVQPDSAGNPNGIHPLSVSGSLLVSESVSGQPPPRTCPLHPNGTSQRCRDCGNAREAHEAWQAAKRARVDAAPKCPTHPTELAANCAGCRSEAIERRAS